VATLLGNGKVLIAGDSRDLIGHSTIAELYDPATGTFSATGSHADPGGDSPLCPQAAVLPNGKVLIMSGCTSAELYDPVEGAFSATGRSSCSASTATRARPARPRSWPPSRCPSSTSPRSPAPTRPRILTSSRHAVRASSSSESPLGGQHPGWGP